MKYIFDIDIVLINFLTYTENVFVPILRSEDNCSTPKVGTPWSPCFHGDLEEVARQDTFGEMKYKVSAFAGPMSPQEVT